MKNSLNITSILLLFIVSISLISFTYSHDFEEFKAIHISSIWEIPLKTGEHLTFPRKPDLIYSNNYEILREPYTITTTYSNHLNQDAVNQNRSTTVDTCCTFSISKRGEKYGMYYKSLEDLTGQRVKVDSLIEDLLHLPSIFYNGRGRGKDSVTVIRDDKNGLLTEKVTMRKVYDFEPDSSIFYYRKKPLDFSYLIKDKRADNMYLYKAIIIYNHIPKADNINNLSDEKTKFRHSFELTEINVPDKEEIKILIDKFKRSSVNKEK